MIDTLMWRERLFKLVLSAENRGVHSSSLSLKSQLKKEKRRIRKGVPRASNLFDYHTS